MSDKPKALATAINEQTTQTVMGGQDDPPYVDVAPGLTDQVREVITDHGFAVDGKAARKDTDIGQRYTRVFLREIGGDPDG